MISFVLFSSASGPSTNFNLSELVYYITLHSDVMLECVRSDHVGGVKEKKIYLHENEIYFLKEHRFIVLLLQYGRHEHTLLVEISFSGKKFLKKSIAQKSPNLFHVFISKNKEKKENSFSYSYGRS